VARQSHRIHDRLARRAIGHLREGAPRAAVVNVYGQFTGVQTHPLTGQAVTVPGSDTLAPPPEGDLTFLTLVSQGQLFLTGLFAQPGPVEFIIGTSTMFLLLNRQ
jgi:hypothetical protein